MQKFLALLDKFVAVPPEERPAIEAEIWGAFGVERAVLALDMSGFSLNVRRSGIVSYLGQVRRMLRLSVPIVEAHRGEVVKAQADDLVALFVEPSDALQAAQAINAALMAERVANPGPIPLAASIGIDFGRILLVAGRDCFGDAVNVAFKLGEDLAVADEILLTTTVRDRLPASLQAQFAEAEASVGGLSFPIWRGTSVRIQP